MSSTPSQLELVDLEPSRSVFYQDVVAGLQADEMSLPSKYFYDERGSRLFEQICGLREYYLTRTELAIMSACAEEMAVQIGPRAALVEYGSGSSVKTEMLLSSLIEPIAYVPVDISREHLRQSARRVAARWSVAR